MAAGVTLLSVAGCRNGVGPRGETRCPPPGGEFPRACAVVRARAVDRDSRPIAALGVRVDSVVPGPGYAYTSNGALTDADGRFELIVYRQNELAPPTTPDTASVEIRAMSGSAPLPGQMGTLRALARMRFAPLGSHVEPTVGDIVFTSR